MSATRSKRNLALCLALGLLTTGLISACNRSSQQNPSVDSAATSTQPPTIHTTPTPPPPLPPAGTDTTLLK